MTKTSQTTARRSSASNPNSRCRHSKSGLPPPTASKTTTSRSNAMISNSWLAGLVTSVGAPNLTSNSKWLVLRHSEGFREPGRLPLMRTIMLDGRLR
jgi:hypothetical protein